MTFVKTAAIKKPRTKTKPIFKTCPSRTCPCCGVSYRYDEMSFVSVGLEPLFCARCHQKRLDTTKQQAAKQCNVCGCQIEFSMKLGVKYWNAVCKSCTIKKQDEERSRKDEERNKQQKQNKLKNLWHTLSNNMLAAFEKHMMGVLHEQVMKRHYKQVAIEDKKLEELKKGIEWKVCSLCKCSCDTRVVKEDLLFGRSLLCKKCHKYKWYRCELCNGCFDLETFERGDDYCTECYEEHINPVEK